MRVSNRKAKNIWVLIIVAIALHWASSVQLTSAAPYNECRLPPQIASTAQSNIMLIMDFSGSMQQPAYYDHTDWSWTYENSRVFNDYRDTTSIIGGTYDRTKFYYGLFQSNEYYKYDFTTGSFYSIVDPSDGSANSTDNLGNWGIGVRGNVLNWAFTSRMDSAMKALIGGKAYDASGGDCDGSDPECFLKSEGSRRRLRGSTSGTNSIDADLYIRPANAWTTSTAEMPSGYAGRWTGLPNGSGPYPDTYAEPSESMPLKDLWVSIAANYRGYLDTADPVAYNKYYELWTFTLDKRTRVEMSLDVPGTWSGNKGLLAILTSPTVNDNSYTRYYGDPATCSVELAAGTYWVRVAPADEHSPNWTGAYTLNSNVHLTPVDNAGRNGTGPLLTNTIGALPYAAVRVKVDPSQRRGSLHDVWSKARWGFMYYKGVSGHEGKILVRCGQVTGIDQYIRFMEGKEDSVHHEPYPYSGTPTGEALAQAYYYFKGSSTAPSPSISGWPSNINGSNPTGLDPYRTSEPIDGEYKAVTCRKNYVIVMSDGNWCHGAGCTLDPIKPAHVIHMTDLRGGTDFPGRQSVDVFTVFAFNAPGTDDYNWGSRAQKWVAAYGGHRDLSTCPSLNGYPFDRTGYTLPGSSSYNSTDANFTISNCATGNPPNACCKEWDLNYDPLYPGGPTGKGIPDNYFEVQSGDQLETAISSILGRVEQERASSSAVATVAQQSGEGDLIIRGMFQAKPPEDEPAFLGKYLWWGHLESFWPNSDGQYDFELYSEVMCRDIRAAHPGASNCWDGAMTPPWPAATSVETPGDAGRHIFTFKRNTSGVLEKKTFNTTNIEMTDLGVTTVAERDSVVNWVLGNELSGKRARVDHLSKHWILGDLVYSTPVVVGPPSTGAVSSRTKAIIGSAEVEVWQKNDAATAAGFAESNFFLNWRQKDATGRSKTSPCVADSTGSMQYRDKVVYVGGNDGMLHAFLLQVYDFKNDKWARHPDDYDGNTCAADRTRIQKIGRELWAYIPSNLLTELKSLALDTYAQETGGCQHRYMVDLAPRAWEVFFDDQAVSGVPWHTVLIGGERGGGDMYFALDVTNPWDPKVLWEYSVVKDLTTRFNASDAAAALMSACNGGTPINPGTLLSNCQAPVPPSSWWPSCSSWNLEQCKNQINGAFDENRFWMPFDESAYTTLKKLPMSWSTPNVGRVKLPVEIESCPPACDVCFAGSTCPEGWTQTGTCTGGRLCTPSCTSSWNTTAGVHNFVFIGGGLRNFDPELDVFDTFSSSSRDFYKKGFGRALWEPFLLALDIRTGKNAFRYWWPEVVRQSSAFFPETTRSRDCTGAGCTLRVPYAMSDPVVLDVWSDEASAASQDGYKDSIYVSDMNGLLYGIKLNFGDPDTTARGMYVDLWKVKPIPIAASGNQDRESNWYRSTFQPFTVAPSVAYESQEPGSTDQWLRVVIAGGKHEDIDDAKNDSTDTAKMSIYNLRERVDFTSLGGSSWAIGETVKGGTLPNAGDLIFRVRANCNSTTYRCTGETASECSWTATGKDEEGNSTSVTQHGCQWFNPATGQADCCEGACQSPAKPCWSCVFDLQETGEKVIGKPLIAGGVVFLTSFKPITKDPCKAGGEGFLYAFDFMCRPFAPGFNPIHDTTSPVLTFPTGATGTIAGARLSLGTGIPSQPVLDSSGKYVIIQNSHGEMGGDGQGPGPRVDLPNKPTQIKGWTGIRD